MTMTPPLQLGSRRELFLDYNLIERLVNTTLRLHEPVSGGVAIRLDKPWEGPANFGHIVFEHAGRYLMYYRGMTLEVGDESGVLCVAESTDGVTWSKPNLGRGDTNIVVDEDGNPRMLLPWLDHRPGVPEDERIKAIASEPVSGEKHTAFADPQGPKRLAFWVSADGFSFRKLNPQPELISSLTNCFDGGNTLFWSEAEQQYVLYYRWYEGEWGTGHRSMARTTSRDLLQWSASVQMGYSGTPREQFYTNNTQPYFRAPHLYIAPSARFMEGRRVVTDEQVEAIGLKTSHGYFYGNDCADGVLLTSRAGSEQYQRTFMQTFIRPGLGANNWVSRTNYPLTGILPVERGQMMLFVNRHYMQESWHIERLLLRTDGFASLNAPWEGGEMLTKTFTFTGRQLEINYRTSAAGFIRVEMQDDAGKALPGYALADCVELIGDEIERTVAWKEGADVERFAGQPVRLRFALKDADVFAMKFSSSKP